MRPERIEPVDQSSETARKGPQLVPSQKAVRAQYPVSTIETVEAHPMVPLFIAGVIAFTGAITFFGSIVTWLLVRHTGVNWMFQ
ncbi:MAG TPA: hypothetical protein VKU42_04700 [Candidatus Angelobacter sp.]|nr:hypothetical protein [Candidatus Angelobacter sp.]